MPSPLDPAIPKSDELGRFNVAPGIGLPPITHCRWCRGPLRIRRTPTTSDTYLVCVRCDTARKDPA